MAGEVDDVRPVLGDERGQFVDPTRLGEGKDDDLLPQAAGRLEHGVFLALEVELCLVGGRGGEEEQTQRAGVGRRRRDLGRDTEQAPGGVAAQRQVRVQFHQFPGQIQQVRVRAVQQQQARPGPEHRLHGRPGRGEDEVEEGAPQQAQVGLVAEGSVSLLEQRQEARGEVTQCPDRGRVEGNGRADGPAVAGPVGLTPGGKGSEQEINRGHAGGLRDVPQRRCRDSWAGSTGHGREVASPANCRRRPTVHCNRGAAHPSPGIPSLRHDPDAGP